MVKKASRIIEGVNVEISSIDAMLTLNPTVSDKDSPDLVVKLRYLIDQTELLVAKVEESQPRRYEKDHGFVTLPIARAGAVATAVWDAGVACIRNPSGVAADGRTAGGISTVYTLELENPNAATQTAWLEDDTGTVLSVIYHIAPTDTLIIDYPGGKTFGDIDLFINASVDGVVCQISGTEV